MADALDLSDDADFDALMDACREGNERIVKVSLGRRSELVNGYHGGTWWTPVHKAAVGGQAGILTLLVDAKVDVNAQNDRGTTALILATYTSTEPTFVDCIRLLLCAGADKTLKDEFGQTALDYAREDEHAVAIDLLTKDDANE